MVLLNKVLQKGSNCTDLFPNILKRKFIKFALKKVGGGGVVLLL